MAPTPPTSLSTLLASSAALLDQFTASLSSPHLSTTPAQDGPSPSPTTLLSAAAGLLKSQTTKLTLLTTTPPLTPSAISTCLTALNESILPSLVTVAMLTTPSAYTTAFSGEVTSLIRTAFRDLRSLFALMDERSRDGKPKSEPNAEFKKSINEVTGKVWEDCDLLVALAKGGVAGFVVRKAQQWLELMKDAVKELEEWDPSEEVDENSLFGGVESQEEDQGDGDREEKEEDTTDRATISTGVKDQTLKVLSRVPQSIHVVVKQRLAKLPTGERLERDTNVKLDLILKRTREISECIDESVEAMYMGDLELCLRKAGEARALTIEVVETVVAPWTTQGDAQPEESKEDKYVKRALEWIQKVETPVKVPFRPSNGDVARAEQQKKS